MGDLGELLIAAITVALVGYYKLPGLRAWARSQFTVAIPDHSVKTIAVEPVPTETPADRRSNAVDCLLDHPQTDPEPTSSLTSEPEWIEITREDLIESLALVLVLEPDGSKRKLSQDTIRAAAGMGKETVAALMRKARREPEPVKDATPQPKPNPRFPELTANGRGVSAALKGK